LHKYIIFEKSIGKSLEKTLNTSFCISYIGERRMNFPKKIVQVGQTKYWLNTPDDVRAMIVDLLKQGYSISKIAELTGISERWIKRYLNNY